MLTTYDVRWACDVLRPVVRRQRRRRRPGVHRGRPAAGPRHRAAPSPRPRQLWWLVDRPNLFIKIPATEAGLPAITAVPGRGHQRQRHADLLAWSATGEVMDAFLDRPGAGPGRPATTCPRSPRWRRSSSPGSTPRSTSGWTSSAPPEAEALRGKAAIANARLAYQRYEEVFATDRWQALADAGRPAAAPAVGLDRRQGPGVRRHHVRRRAGRAAARSTRCRRRRCDAVADHGDVRGDTDPRRRTRRRRRCSTALAAVGIDYDDVVQVLEDEGVEKFEASLERAARVDARRELDAAGRRTDGQ